MRFKKMHIGLIVIALCLILGSVQIMPKEAKATAGVQYYYSFEDNEYSGKTSYPSVTTSYQATEYKWNNQHPWNTIEFQKWNIESTGNFINSIGLQGTAQAPFRQPTYARDGTYSLRLWDNVGTPDPNGIHATDTADRSQFQLIPDGQDGFHHLNEFYVGFSMKIPLPTLDPYDHFALNEDGQWVLLYNLHTYPGEASFSINLASATSNSVTSTDVLLKGTAWTLNCKDASQNNCKNTKKEALFTSRMTRGVWYDFLIQTRMSDRDVPSPIAGHVYVRMKRADEKWDTNPNDGVDQYGHMVFSYTGPVGYAVLDPSDVRYYPFINIYRSQHPFPQSGSDHTRDNKHVIYVDEVRVGTDGGGGPGAVIVPGSFK